MFRIICWVASRVTYYHCGQEMEFEAVPRAAYVCGRCGAIK